MKRNGGTPTEMKRLQAQVSALEQLLEAHEEAVIVQSNRVEHTLHLLRDNQARFESFMRHLPGVAYIKDRHGRHVFANRGLEDLLRQEDGAWFGKTNEELFPPEAAAEFSANDRAVLAEGRVMEVTERLRLDGEDQYWLSVKFPIVDKDGATMLGGIAVNMTESRRLEDQLRQAAKMEAVGRLAGGVAHDFNNILTVIAGYSQILLRGLAAEDPMRTQIEEIQKAGQRAAALTQQLLTFSRPQMVQPRHVNLNNLTTTLAGMLHRLIGEHIQLVTRLDPALGWVNADPGQLEQVIVNLAVNARDAMTDGGTLTIETANAVVRTGGADRRMVKLTVRDSGHGMDAETQARIFEPFFTTKEHGKGTGLGLATVYGIVTHNGGTIEVESAPGHGSAFTVLLPRMEGAPQPGQAAEPPVRKGAGVETVLLVEDEPIVLQFVAKLLRDSGYQVLEAADGQSAMDVSRSHKGRIHLLLSDVVMPGLNGRQLSERLVSARPDLKVLFMSGYIDDDVLLRGAKGDGPVFVQKPFETDVLLRKIRELLDGR